MSAHDSWADDYDCAYKLQYQEGCRYQQFTDQTLDVIRQLEAPPARIVDFGAGTGRLAIPLARMGYRVTAVEASPMHKDRGRERPRAIGDMQIEQQGVPIGPGEFDTLLIQWRSRKNSRARKRKYSDFHLRRFYQEDLVGQASACGGNLASRPLACPGRTRLNRTP